MLIIVAAVVGISLLLALTELGRGAQLTHSLAPQRGANSVLAVEVLKRVLSEARTLLPRRVVAHGFAEELVKSSRILNRSTLLVDGAAYRFIVVQAMDAERGVFIAPKTVRVDGVSVRLLQLNRSTTFTGGTQYTYLVEAGGKVCRMSFYFIGFQVSCSRLVMDSESVCDGIYGVSIFVNPQPGSLESYRGVFVVLVPARAPSH